MSFLGYRLEPRAKPPGYVVFLYSFAAVLIALIITGFIFIAFGLNPFSAYATVIQKTLLSWRGFSQVLLKTVPLLLTGVGLVLAFRAQFWNIGAEGQILAGAAAAAGVALFMPLPPFLGIPAMFLAGFIAGGIWGFLPALLKVRLGVNEIITTLMMNYIMLYIVRWLINGPWKGKNVRGFSESDKFDASFVLPLFKGTRLNWPTLLIALLFVLFIFFLLARMKLGFEIRMMGESPEAAHYAGVNFLTTTILLVLLSAGAAGLAGVGEVAGIHKKLLEPTSISQGFGYTAIIVALLARGNPLATLATALLLGWVFASGDVMKVSLRLPDQMSGVINGLLLLCIIGIEPLLRYRIVRVNGAKLGEREASSGT
ncbi:MAG: ABC transporter permease [Trueperaceae bacterium]|nr:ABC transporter permease [Trueperaceae bacterium]